MSAPLLSFMQMPALKGRAVRGRTRGTVRAIASAVEKVLRRELGSTMDDPARAELAATVGDCVADLLAGRSVVLKLDEPADTGARAAIEAFLRSAAHATADLEPARQEAAIARLAEVILPDPLKDARGPLALDNLRLRDRFLAEEAVLTSAEVGERAGHRSRNPYATAARWKKAGKVFSVSHRGAEYFPAFQFRDGQPHPVVARILAALPASMTPWQIAFWFVSANGWLDEDAPRDRLDDADALLAAADHEGEEVMG